LPGPCQPGAQGYRSRAAGLPCDGGVLHQQSRKWDHHVTDLETAAVKARKDDGVYTSTLHFPENHGTKPEDF